MQGNLVYYEPGSSHSRIYDIQHAGIKPPAVITTHIKSTKSVFPFYTDQERAEEDEGDEVEVGKITPTLLPQGSRELITWAVTKTCQHDLMPRLPCRTPEKHTHVHGVSVNSAHQQREWALC